MGYSTLTECTSLSILLPRITFITHAAVITHIKPVGWEPNRVQACLRTLHYFNCWLVSQACEYLRVSRRQRVWAEFMKPIFLSHELSDLQILYEAKWLTWSVMFLTYISEVLGSNLSRNNGYLDWMTDFSCGIPQSLQANVRASKSHKPMGLHGLLQG
jgi:hypothetical protein